MIISSQFLILVPMAKTTYICVVSKKKKHLWTKGSAKTSLFTRPRGKKMHSVLNYVSVAALLIVMLMIFCSGFFVGFASLSMQKDSGCPNSRKTERVLTSSVKGVSSCCEGNETVNMGSEHHKSYSQATCASKQEWNIPKTSSMNLDLVLFQISRMRNPISKELTESPVCSDPSDKWLKRLKHDSTSDHQVPCSKRKKIEANQPPGQTCALFRGLFDNDRDNTGVIEHVKEDQLMHERLMEQKNQGSPLSGKNLNHWIGRWCQGGTPSFHGTSHLGKQLCKSKTPPDCLDSQFPSIGAMAMMGRVMNKLRSCEFEKKGPAVVWKTDGL